MGRAPPEHLCHHGFGPAASQSSIFPSPSADCLLLSVDGRTSPLVRRKGPMNTRRTREWFSDGLPRGPRALSRDSLVLLPVLGGLRSVIEGSLTTYIDILPLSLRSSESAPYSPLLPGKWAFVSNDNCPERHKLFINRISARPPPRCQFCTPLRQAYFASPKPSSVEAISCHSTTHNYRWGKDISISVSRKLCDFA